MATTYSITPSPTTVTEGNQVVFTIARSGDTPAETVYFSTLSDGTATYSAGDYATTSGGAPVNVPVFFGSGVTLQTVTLSILNDGVSDSGEQFRAIVQRYSSDPVTTYLRGRLETGLWGGWPGPDVIPDGYRSQFGAHHVDADHPAAA